MLATPLPPSIVLQSVQVLDAAKSAVLIRLRHQYEVGEHPELSSPVTVDLSTLLAPEVFPRTVFHAASLSGEPTPGGQPVTSVTLGPMEVASFVVTPQ